MAVPLRDKDIRCWPVEKLWAMGYHYGYGGWRETTQVFAERVEPRKQNCPNGQAKTGRSMAKRGELD
jgi:hypothetical protein